MQGELTQQKTIAPIGNAQKTKSQLLDHSQIRMNINQEIVKQQTGKTPSSKTAN